MARINIPGDVNQNGPYSGGTVQKLVNLTPSDWHAVIAGGAAIDVAAGFNTPSAAEADRIPEIICAAGGVEIVATITGTWNGAAQVEAITCPTNATTKCTKPFDTITRFQSNVDPVSNTTLRMGDSYADPPTRCLFTGTGAAAASAAVQLSGETAVKVVPAPAGYVDWDRRVVRMAHTTTTLTAPYFVW
jgi:hypothetical protein